MNLLNNINSPADLRALDRTQLPQLADELRAFVLEVGVEDRRALELEPGHGRADDRAALRFQHAGGPLVWDVGHQTYPHKILTGRREQMDRLRQHGGVSGFPRRSESEYDTFGTAHSSTSISAALGMAVAARNQQLTRHSIAVIGDGAMSAGMAFEALNNAGVTDNVRLLVILNDNDMSISPAVGALNRYLARLMSGKFYATAKQAGKQVLKSFPPVFELAKKFEEHAKGMVVPGTLFEEFGFNYIGPIDGHDLDSLLPTLQNLKQLGEQLSGPQFLHVVTKKGQGYKLAEADPVLYHGPTKFDPSVGVMAGSATKPNYTKIFGDWLCDMAAIDSRLIGITPAMREGSGLVRFEQEYSDRYFDVGIAEQHAVTFAAGLACDGMKPVVAIYSTFLQRAYDQLIHDVCIQNLPVVFALDRGGLVGSDGATHHGAFDLSYLRCLPNTVVMAASDENECRQMLYTAFRHDGPVAVRYPRGVGPGVAIEQTMTELPMGRGEQRRSSTAAVGRRIAILAFGSMVAPALAAAEQLDATVANMRFVKPIDDELVAKLARTHDALVTIEENVIAGGAGSACLESLATQRIEVPVLRLGLPDRFIDHGDPAALLKECGLDAAGITAAIRARFPELTRTVRVVQSAA